MSAQNLKQDTAAMLLTSATEGTGDAVWAQTIRREARTRLQAMGGPVKRDEYWKYTDPAPLIAPLTDQGKDIPGNGVFSKIDALVLTFVDGNFRADLSDDLALENVEITLLPEALATENHWAQQVIGQLETALHTPVPRPLAVLNTLRMNSGIVIRVTGHSPRPVHLKYSSTGAAEAFIRIGVQVAANASITLLESGSPAQRYNTLMEVDLAEGAGFHHIREQTCHPTRLGATHIFTRLASHAQAKSFTLTANGTLSRNEIIMSLEGDDASAHVGGGVLGANSAHLDNTIHITHGAENGESRQVYKNVLKDSARSVFQGKILVREGAQKTDGYQISQSVLLSEQAEFDAKPELEIYADDVKCSHGSTTGALDAESLFYLRSRGVPEQAAQAMLVMAFVEEAIAEIADPALQDEMRLLVAQWMEV